MQKEELATRLSYVREKTYIMLESNSSYRHRRMYQETILELCKLLEELNAEHEMDRTLKPKEGQ